MEQEAEQHSFSELESILQDSQSGGQSIQIKTALMKVVVTDPAHVFFCFLSMKHRCASVIVNLFWWKA